MLGQIQTFISGTAELQVMQNEIWLNVALLELSLSVYSNAYVELISLRLFLGGDGFLLV